MTSWRQECLQQRVKLNIKQPFKPESLKGRVWKHGTAVEGWEAAVGSGGRRLGLTSATVCGSTWKSKKAGHSRLAQACVNTDRGSSLSSTGRPCHTNTDTHVDSISVWGKQLWEHPNTSLKSYSSARSNTLKPALCQRVLNVFHFFEQSVVDL